MVQAKPINKMNKEKKRKKRFHRFQSDTFMRVDVRCAESVRWLVMRTCIVWWGHPHCCRNKNKQRACHTCLVAIPAPKHPCCRAKHLPATALRATDGKSLCLLVMLLLLRITHSPPGGSPAVLTVACAVSSRARLLW